MRDTLFHISQHGDIEFFAPRPSPMAYNTITGPVVFAICEEKLHNYLLPRNCPRVCYYAGLNTAAADVERFITPHNARYIVCIEERWRAQMENTVLYCYELPDETFELLDEIAGYIYPIKRLGLWR